MNTENTTQTRGKLEKLSPEQQSYIVELAKKSTLENVAEALNEHGIDVSPSTLSRFIRKRRGEELVEDGKEMAASVEALAEQGRGGKLREGTLEVMRQKFFEKAAQGYDAEEARAVYDALVKEEARVKELELEARKVAALEQQVRLQERRIEVEAMKARAALGRVQAHGVGSKEVKAVKEGNELKDGAEEKGEVRRAGEGDLINDGGQGEHGEEMPHEREGGIAGERGALRPEGRTPNGDGAEAELRNARWVEVVGKALEVLNRGGDPGERILEAREILNSEFRLQNSE